MFRNRQTCHPTAKPTERREPGVHCWVCGSESPGGKRFCGNCGAPLVGPARAPDAEPASARLGGVERRSITIMFADLVGSTELSTRVDAEGFREVISACHRVIADSVKRFGGFIARFVGDAALVLLGYPLPHEDDTARAVRAALAANEAIAELRLLDGRFEPRLRTGIATGVAVVGDLLGSGTDVAGETPNFAARLHSLARPGEIIISDATGRLLDHRFELRRRADVRLKGFPDPVGVFRVIGAARSDDGLWCGGPAPLAPMLARVFDRAVLSALWDKAKTGSGQVVFLSGEPGIGKSRLLSVLQDDVAETGHIRLRYYCSPYHTGGAPRPAVARLAGADHRAQTDSGTQGVGKPGGSLDPTQDGWTDIARIADARVPAALMTRLDLVTSRAPVLLLVEDAHWADPAARELMDRVVEAAAERCLLMVVAGRPEFQPDWNHHAHVTTLALSRLERADAMAMVATIARDRPLPMRLVDDIVSRSDGVPLFIEEMTTAALDTDSIRLEPQGPGPRVAIPESLSASLLARLGPPSVMREVAQIGATIGREFAYDILARVTDHPAPILRKALTGLVETGLVFPRGRGVNRVFVFRLPWCATPPMGCWCGRNAAICTARSPRRSARIARIWLGANRNCSRGTPRRRDGGIGRRPPAGRERPAVA